MNIPVQAKTALVTGASGFIGRYLCRHLVRQGIRVTGVSHQHPEWMPEGVQAQTTDLTNANATDALIAQVKPEWIFHLASFVTGGRDMDLVRPTFQANLASTVYLMTSAARQGCCRRFILTGSLEEPERVGAAPSSPYAAAKAAATAYARMFHALYQLPTVIARVFMVYGPDQKDEKKLVPYVINSLLNGQSPRMGSGTRLVDWIYVEDVVAGLLRLATGEDLAGKTVDIGSGQMESVRAVAERIARLMAPPVPLHFDPAADRPLEQVRAANMAQTEALTGWRPHVSLDEGLQATIDWYRARVASGR